MATLAPLFRPQFFDANGDPLAGGKIYTYEAGTTTLLATYTDSTGVTPNANPIILDANGECNIWLDAEELYKIVIKDSSDVTIKTIDNVSNYAESPILLYRWGGTSGGTADALTLTPSATPTEYTTGMKFDFLASSTNTGAATVNVSSLGAKSIKSQAGAALSAGEIVTGGVYSITYNGTDFILSTVADSSITKSKLASNARDLVFQAKTANYTILYSDDVIEVDASGGAVTLTMFAASSGKKPIKVKKTDSSFNAVTIQRAGSDTIEDVNTGLTSTTLNTQGEEIEIAAKSSSAFSVLSRRIPSIWSSWTPTITNGGTTSTLTCFKRRSGDSLELQFLAIWSGAGAGARLLIDIPDSLVTDTTKTFAAGVASAAMLGVGGYTDGSTLRQLSVSLESTTQMKFSYGSNSTTLDVLGSDIANGFVWSFSVRIPIVGWNG